MTALIIAIMLWLGGITGLENTTTPGLIEDYQIEYTNQNQNSSTDVNEWEIGG